MTKKTGSTVQSVDRALLILAILQEHRDGLGVTELSHRLDVAKSTVHRLLASLKQQGYVRKDETLEKYYLGLKLLELGEVVAENIDLRQICKPYLNELAKKTGETVHLGVQEENEVIYVDKVERFAPIRMYSSIGKRSPLYCTGIGKALLAFMPVSARTSLLTSFTFHSYTDQTITDPDALEKELLRIEKQKFAIDDEEHESGIRCTAAPLWNHRGEVIAAISVAGSSSRMTDEKLDQCTQELLHACKLISESLGF